MTTAANENEPLLRTAEAAVVLAETDRIVIAGSYDDCVSFLRRRREGAKVHLFYIGLTTRFKVAALN